MSLWIPTHVALGTRPLLGSSEREKKVLRGVEPRLKECPIHIESETFVLTVIPVSYTHLTLPTKA